MANTVYLVLRSYPYEGDWTFTVKDNLTAAKQAAQDHADKYAKDNGKTPQVVKWTRDRGGTSWTGDSGQYDGYSIERWRVESK